MPTNQQEVEGSVKIDPAKLAVIRDVLNEMGVEVQSDEEVEAGLELLKAVVEEKRLRGGWKRKLYYGEWLDHIT